MAISPALATIEQQLATDFAGRVISPADPDYDAARTVFPGGFDRRPAAIARPAGTADVARLVDVARESGIELAVRAGGHSGAGHGVIDDGLVIDLRDMRGLDVDAEARTAWAQTGLTAGEYTTATAEHGLATGFGDTASVGISGISLGGGVGYLSRAYGLTIDDLLAAEIVTADGQVLEVDEDNHPDLFWAIRGAGANFGVATRLRFRLRELATVVGGPLILPASAEVVTGMVAAATNAPEELSVIASVMPAPPMPFVPPERHGELVVMALVCYSGPVEQADAVLAPLRELAEPIADMVRPIPYPEIYPPDPEDFHPTVVIRTMFVDGIDADAAQAMIEYLESSDAPMRVCQIRVLGGAIARVPNDATAFAHRDAAIMLNVASFWTSPEDLIVRRAWVDELAGKVSTGGTAAYVNFLGDEGPERVRAAYPGATWERLTAIKRQYDPENLFRGNQNIPPAEG